MTKSVPIIQKEKAEINEILKASKQIKQGNFYTGDLKDIIKKRKNNNKINRSYL